jgi:hypothetical protein
MNSYVRLTLYLPLRGPFYHYQLANLGKYKVSRGKVKNKSGTWMRVRELWYYGALVDLILR